MKKLRLELDELSVESFETLEETSGARGTVRGHFMAVAPTRYLWQCGYTRDVAACYTADGGFSCEPVYTCPECASPPETYDVCGTVDLCA